MFKRDRSILFKETLLDASLKNEFGFQEQDILPLFLKYQSKRQILINIVSFMTYVVQLATQFYLRRLQRGNTVYQPGTRFNWFKVGRSKS